VPFTQDVRRKREADPSASGYESIFAIEIPMDAFPYLRVSLQVRKGNKYQEMLQAGAIQFAHLGQGDRLSYCF